MKALVQRVGEASAAVDGRTVGRIGRGLLVLFCAAAGDTDGEADTLARKVARLRIFEDDAGTMNRALPEVGGGNSNRRTTTLPRSGLFLSRWHKFKRRNPCVEVFGSIARCLALCSPIGARPEAP